MAKFVWGADPLALQRLGQPERKCPLSVPELARLGIPARKIPRVQAELARLAADEPCRAPRCRRCPAHARQLL